MARCDNERTVKLERPIPDNKGGLIYNIPVPCGKCYNCKKNRCNQWSFRMMKELQIAKTARFVTLTYDTLNVPITKNGFMTLKKKDLQDFFKRLRYYEKESFKKGILTRQKEQWIPFIKENKIKYYAVGEYGSARKRPHYHIILFNCMDENNITRAWTNGSTHQDEVNNNTIDYTLKYLMKENGGHKFKAFDGISEFSVMSKGIGDNHLTEQVKRFYKKNLEINYNVNEKGHKIPQSKYYRERIYDKKERKKQIAIIKEKVEEQEKKTTELAKVQGKMYRQDKLNKSQNNRYID